MRAICMSLLLAACNWAVINIERTSSGAVERDVDFRPSPGTDGHYISLPAYPLVNCADTLVYDKLLTDFIDAAAHADALQAPADFLAASRAAIRRIKEQAPERAIVEERRDDSIFKFLTALTGTTLAKVARVSHDESITSALVELARQGSDLAKLRAIAPGKRKGSGFVCLAKMHDRIIDYELIKNEAYSEGTHVAIERERLKRAFVAAMSRATAIAAAASPELKKQIPLISKLARLSPAQPGCSPVDREVIEALVEFAKETAGHFDNLRKMAPRDAFSQKELERMSLDGERSRDVLGAITSFVKLASSFGASACASGARYRDFLGYIKSDAEHNASWIDRSKDEQLAQLQLLEHDVGLVSDTEWPKAELAFLHFSDLQIREPSAKLGGSDVSGTLRNLQPSFEQDYDQQQNSLFVYDAIVATANAEWCLYHPGHEQCHLGPSAIWPDEYVRPAPVMMIHTGDAVDIGLQSEFDTFLAYSDKLHVPWYQVIGNHDILGFGNLKLSSKNAPRDEADECQGWGATPCTCTNLNTLVRAEVARTPDNQGMTPDAISRPWFTQLPNIVQRVCILHQVASDWFVMDPDKQRGGNSISSFVLSHCGGWRPRPGDASDRRVCTRTSDQAPVAEQYAYRGPGVPMNRCAIRADDPGGMQTSHLHGFDLQPGFKLLENEPGKEPSRDLGYYCFQIARDRAANGGRVWGVVLNTNTDAGAFGVLPREQLHWLRGLLPAKEACARGVAETREDEEERGGALIGCKDLVLLFAHHPLWSLYDQRDRLALTEIVTTRPNVVGMFVGHKHRSDLRMIRPLAGSDGQAKWEVMAASVSEWPQAASEVTLKTHGQLGYFEVLTFTPHGTGESAAKIRAAAEGAIRDKCRNEPHQCPDGDGRIRSPNRDLTFPRLFFRLPGSTPESHSGQAIARDARGR